MSRSIVTAAVALALLAPSIRAQGLLIERIGSSATNGLGRNVCMFPDLDGDGHPDFAVAASGPFNNIGRVYIYSGFDLSAMLVVVGNSNSAVMGSSLAAVGDVDHDGLPDIAVGASGESKVYVLKGNTANVLFTLSDGGNGNMGMSTAGAGDVNGDGWPDILAGAPDYSTWQSTVGRAYVYSGFDGSLIRMHEGSAVLQGAGRQLCGGVDIDGDGKSDYMVGDSYNGGAPASAVRLYSGATGALLQTFSIAPEPIEFGLSMVFVDDLDSDGIPDVALGSPGDATIGQDAGRVDWFSTATGLVLRTSLGASVGARFGTEISDAGDVNGDGMRDLWVSSPGLGGTFGRIKLLSGLDATQLMTINGIASNFLPHISGGFDLDGDGKSELVAGTLGSFRLFSTAPARGATYCTAKTNSLACVPVLAATGTASRSAPDDFHLLATNVLNNKPGIVIWSRARGYSPLGNGSLCLSSPIFRRTLGSSGGSPSGLDCTGVYDYYLSHAEMNLLGMLAGDTVYTQMWSRDPGFSPPNNIGLTNGWVFTMAP